MAAPDSQLYLVQMLDNIERIRLWTNGHTLETYRANLMLRDAVERCLDVLRHEYDDVADAEVWRIVVDDLSALKSAVQSMLDKS
jgi:uncharacterized protein with HEPN domain